MDAGRSLVSIVADAGRDRRGPLAAISVQPGDAARARGVRVRSDARAGLQSGDLAAWLIEWKWDGIRAQLVKRDGAMHLWSRGEELITDRFPEVIESAAALPDGVVLDGEVLAFRDGRPLPFSALQQRIGRQKQVARKARDVPVVFMTFDVLEHEGRDIRVEPLSVRRALLETLVASAARSVVAPNAHDRTDETHREALLPFEDEAESQMPDAASRVLQVSSTIAVRDGRSCRIFAATPG